MAVLVAWLCQTVSGNGGRDMRGKRNGTPFIASVCAAILALSACTGSAEDAMTFREVDLQSPVPPAAYAGDVAFRVAQSFAARGQEVPFAFYLGLAPAGGTRLGANAFGDMRGLQKALPGLLSGPIEASCSIGLNVNFGGIEAEGDVLRAGASVKASLYRCKDRDTPEERRGFRMISQTVDVNARLRAGLAGNCIRLELADLGLKPRGILGGLATLFGFTERVRAAIFEKAETVLAENLVCPTLPEPIAILEPQFTTLGVREVGGGGVGMALSGSADIGADNLIAILAWLGANAEGDGALRFVPAPPGQVRFDFDNSLEVKGEDLAYGIDARLSPVDATRIGMEALLDLGGIQKRLPDLLTGQEVIDSCGGHVTIERFETEADGTAVIARASLEMESFDCVRTGEGSWERGVLEETKDVDVRADLSAELVEGCVVFRLLDLTRDPPGALGQIQTASGRLEAARALVLEAVGLVLEEAALCPELPPELVVLKPRFDYGAPQEIGEGGLGVAMKASIDVSPETVVDMLTLLQDRGLLPPAP